MEVPLCREAWAGQGGKMTQSYKQIIDSWRQQASATIHLSGAEWHRSPECTYTVRGHGPLELGLEVR